MGTVIAIVNQKGGVGKTTTAISLSSSLALYGKKCLLVDLDPQANATTGLGVDLENIKTIYDALLDEAPSAEVIIPTAIEGLSLIPASIDLAGAEIELVSTLARESRLRQALVSVANDYDYILIDSPPSLGLLTINSLVAAEKVIIPIQTEFYALTGVSQLIKTLSLIRRSLNPEIEVLGVLLTMFDARTKLSQEVSDELRRHFSGNIFSTIIPRNIRLTEAPSHGQPVGVYAADSRGAKAYFSLAKEVMQLLAPEEIAHGQTDARSWILDSAGTLGDTGGELDRIGDQPDSIQSLSTPPESGQRADAGDGGLGEGPWGDSASGSEEH